MSMIPGDVCLSVCTLRLGSGSCSWGLPVPGSQWSQGHFVPAGWHQVMGDTEKD